MIKLSRILTLVLCCAPAFAYGAGPVATTSGSNLTAYNPSTAYNNQWAMMTNGRYDGDTNARVDFGNCNAVVLRCAQPKCANGGCTDSTVAGAIVAGCVKANDSCKKYGEDLISYMTAQLVANSTAKVQEQQMALEQAKIQAEAQAQAAAAASNAQNEQMMAQMQSQMQQMQQQMAQQQEESNRQLQEALAQQAAQSAAAVESMKNAATEVAQQTEAGITSYQQEAINRGISEDVLARQQITGQIMTEIENADLKLKEVKTAMQNSFDYAKCDARGNNCGAPKRIKKWRELASGFLEPYDETIDRIYDALVTAQTVGVDLSQIYMMLNDSCNSWGQYLCEKTDDGGYIDYGDGKGNPKSCKKKEDCGCEKQRDLSYAYILAELEAKKSQTVTSTQIDAEYAACVKRCDTINNCKPCTLLKVLTDGAEVYEGWINPTADKESNGTVIACASNALDSSKLFTRRTKNKNGAGLVDIDKLDTWLNQVEPSKSSGDNPKPEEYCGVDYDTKKSELESKTLSRSVNTEETNQDKAFCINWKKRGQYEHDSTCPYIAPLYAVCDTHPYNANLPNMEKSSIDHSLNTENQEKMNEIIGLKITVISQQMYKQYEYLRATLQRLRIQLEKSVLTSNLEAAGAKSDSSSSGGGLLGKGSDDSEIVLAGAENCWNASSPENAYSCIQNNLNLIKSNAATNKTKAAKQLGKTVDVAKQWGIDSCAEYEKGSDGKDTSDCKTDNCSQCSARSCSLDKNGITLCANALSIAVARKIADEKRENNRYSGWGGQRN